MNFFKTSYRSTAKVVDGSLVLSLPDALVPTLMRMDLEEVRAAALEVTPRKETYVLTLKVSKDNIRDIAPFETREQAVAALMAASQALEKGSARANYTPADEQRAGTSGSALKWVGAVGVVLFLFWIVSSMGSQIPRPPASEGATNTASATGASAGGKDATGVPLSADEYLARQTQ